MGSFEEFDHGGKHFVYIDLSGFKSNGEMSEFTRTASKAIARYSENSIYTITNVEDVRFETDLRKIVVDYLSANSPYVKCGAIIGIDGIKKVIISKLLKTSGRKNIFFSLSRKQAFEQLLKHD